MTENGPDANHSKEAGSISLLAAPFAFEGTLVRVYSEINLTRDESEQDQGEYGHGYKYSDMRITRFPCCQHPFN
jgi:hypothetical protein